MPKAHDHIGPYQLTRKLGEGGFGEVWLALEISGSGTREVAVKMPLNSEIDLDALLQEATVWARATGHPNVLGFLAARVFDGRVVLVSEYAPDSSLKDWLKRYGGRAPSVEAAVEMTQGILSGLEHLHARSIIHRDIKPDNVLLLGATPRLADFGISRVLKSTHKSVVTAGTPAYMAPEAFDRTRNQQTDLWSVGVILYQMLSGRLPFDGDDITELYGAIRNEEPPPLPTAIPEWLQQIVAKALTKDPRQRYQTAAEMRAALISQRPTLVGGKLAAIPTVTALPGIEAKHEPSSTLAKPARSNGVRPAIKWGLGVTVIATVITTYLMTRTPARLPTSLMNMVSSIQSPPDWGEAFTESLNDVKLEMVRVPAGEFLMGSPEDEPDRSKDEGPQHRVIVPSFYIGKYEVTQAQWKAVMGTNPSNPKGDELPIEPVSWNAAKSFCQKLSEITKKAYRLPSEAEWEYACRARTTGTSAGDLNEVAWYLKNSGGKPHPVGQKQPNIFKLYDLQGNVWEWCEDVYHNSYGGRNGTPPHDGKAWLIGGEQGKRVLRGGAWDYAAQHARSANRGWGLPDAHKGSYGLRVVVSKTP